MKNLVTMVFIINLLALASATSLEIAQKHVFAGEEFTVVFKTNAPLSQHTARIKFGNQEKKFTVPTKAEGLFTKNLTFKAPEKPGEYTISGEEASTKVVVEEPLLTLENVKLDSEKINPGDTTQIGFTIKNVGEYMVYNVAYQLVLSNPEDYEFNSEKQTIGNMRSGESQTKVEEIKAKPSANNPTRIEVVVEYVFDGETHYWKADVQLSVETMEWLDWLFNALVIIAVVIILIEFYAILSKRVKKDQKRSS